MADVLTYIVHHVFLPPQLPQQDDWTNDNDAALIQCVIDAVDHYESLNPAADHAPLQHYRHMLSEMLHFRDNQGNLVTERLASSLQQLADGGLLAIHVRAQNAAVIVRRASDRYMFESFEVSPTAEDVMSTQGRLRRCFPGPAVNLEQDRIVDPCFRSAWAQLLVRLDLETPMEMCPVTVKTGAKTSEIRDTVNPAMVTQLLMGFLRALGSPGLPAPVYKNTRDDVLWKKGLKPWRRSPLWLVLRVAMQTHLMLLDEIERGHAPYKSFMLFLMARILNYALDEAFPTDVLFVMAAKITQRTLKVDPADDMPARDYIESSVRQAHEEMARRWAKLEAEPDPDHVRVQERLSRLSPMSDTALSVPKLGPYLKSVAARSAAPAARQPSVAACLARLSPVNTKLPELVIGDHDHLALTDLEVWVHQSLDGWAAAHLHDPDAGPKLATLTEMYLSAASEAYQAKPEETSVLFLVAVELWVALDRCTVCQFPLLGQYPPEIPLSVFEPLLLPDKSQMERLGRVEQYLLDRVAAATTTADRVAKGHRPSIFEAVDHADAFAVKYFDQSTRHHDLKRRIEAQATSERAVRRKEMADKTRQYHDLIQSASPLACEYSTTLKRNKPVCTHNSTCQRCTLMARAKNLSVAVHEWPLPSDEFEAKSAVVEMDLPERLARWRDITYHLLVDLYELDNRQQEKSTSTFYTLLRCQSIQPYVRSAPSRLQLASLVKPWGVSHYKTKAMSEANESSIFVPHGPHYAWYDTVYNRFTVSLSDQGRVRQRCTIKLSTHWYRKLHFAIENTTHTSNEALAKQSDCPDDMSLHEFYSFATLRAGARLQWRNMARELSDRVINLNRVETYVFMAQAAWQAGVRGSDDRTARENHIDLEEEGFGMSLLDRLDAAAATIQDNWQNACAVRILTLLTARLLTLASGAAVRDRCYCTLRRLRNIALDWTRDLVQRVQDEHDQTIVTDLSARALELALTCHATYNVDWPHLRHLLASDVDVAAVTESSIVIHDRCPAVTDTLSASTQALLRSHFRRCHRLEPVLRRYIHTQPNGLDETIGRLWGGYKTGTAWQALPAPDERWLAATTASTANNASMQVHFNLLDGTLLINGSPLARLPRSYEEHPTFRRLFGERILDVVPSTMSDMRFESRTRLQDHQVFFSMSNDELIVRSRKDERTYEALPLRVLEGEFPQAFVRDYVHWLEPATGRVEWRPLTNLWMSSPEHNWVMQPNSSGGQVLIQGALQLVDVSSDTAAAVASVLRPLEVSTHLHLTWHQKTRRLHVHLPRLSLDFEMAEGSSCLASRQFRGLRVDHDPSIGTLTGLSSKLVLRHIDGTSRSILVPHGKVQCRLDRGHVHVTIRPDEEAARVAYDMYRVDNQLGQLVDNGRLMSRLFRCYLHAVTASCLVDQLSGRTGTEEALAILASQLVTSSLHLGPDELQLLYQIAALTPSREYYPDQLRVMQTVCWHSKLSPLAQSPSFACAVRSIRDQVDYMRIFCDDEEAWRNIDRGSLGLHQRAAHRHATVCVNSFDAGSPTSEHDVAYLGRDGPSSSEREHHVFDVAKLVDQWTGALYSRGQLLPTMQLGDTTVAGRGVGPAFSLGYDPKWLEEPATYLPNHWVALQAALTHSDPEKDKYAVMVFLSTIAFGRHGADDLAPMLLAFATVPALRKLPLPRYDAFPLRDGAQPQYPMLRMSLRKYAWSFEHSPEARLPRLFDEDDEEADDRRREAHDKARAQSEDLFVHRLTSQFPIEYLTTPSTDGLTQYFNVGPAMEAVQPMFHAWFRNHRFLSYMSDAQVILDRLQSWAAEPRPDAPAKPDYRYRRQRRHITFEYLFSQPAPKLSAARGAVPSHWIASSHEQRDHARLRALLDSLWRESAGDHERKYSDDLEKSFEALLLNTDTTQKVTAALQKELLDEHHEQCQAKLRNATQILLEHLRPMQTMALRMSHVAQMTPRLSRVSLLQQLAHDRFGALPYEWKRALVEYGVIVTKLQQAKRLKSVAHAPAELLAELSNRGHDGWDPHQRPEWLLLELENDLLIRPRQAQIAHAMMTPSSGDNAVMQLNMGEGKSSVIVPMVAAALADGAKLVRVIVLKPLMVQMFRVLVSKFGGMLGRRIFHLPVTRSQPLNLAQARRIQAMCDECMRVGGVLLVQPEHLLSFKLMGLERLLAGETDVGNALISTRRFFDHHARDVLDESDEILSVRFELIYTMGTQRDVEFAPSRWVTIQHVLGMIRRMAPALRDMFPDGVELQDAPNGSFPRLRILDGAAGERLMNNLAHDISELGVPGLAVGTLAPVKSVLLGFLGDAKMTPSAGARLRNSAFDVKSVWQCLLLLRGLIAGGVLLFALQRKRWRVNYGLDLSRTMLAVPYRAKDDPATRAEFSHPDATIVLTCISYYYGGLSDAQLTTAIETLELCDHGQEEYDLWVHDAPKLPPQFHRLAGINLKNKSQCATVVFPALHLAKGAIDFYLSQIVFPHEMKEFPDKLSASGWDIACARTHPTTGFSGTNDSRYVLPSSIEQCDLPEQLHTNALVLQHLLQPENTLAPTPIQLDVTSLLQMVVDAKPEVRVLLDVGAQVLEWRNDEVARQWLLRVPDAQASVYFDDRNDLVVRSRDGHIESLLVSPWAEQMDQCLVYLDESHTRGTDLKLPTNYRAAVTLGPNLTKDRLVQACMRMRKLGHGQSVMFCASPEVKRHMSRWRSGCADLDVFSVLRWAIATTCRHTKESISLWALQGMRYQRHHALWSPFRNNPDRPMTGEDAKGFLEGEAQSLEDRYDLEGDGMAKLHIGVEGNGALPLRHEQVEAIRAKCEQFQLTSISHAKLQEEQERELSPEIEYERQVQRPPALEALRHKVRPDLVRLAQTGRLHPDSQAVQPAFQLLHNTSAALHLEDGAWPGDLRTTVDFARTVWAPANENLDSYLRPVHWILSWTQDERTECLIISPSEANNLLPSIRRGQLVTLHVYSARVSMSAPSLEHLAFCAVPAVAPHWRIPPSVQPLNLFAGQLYVHNYDDYVSMCRSLGLCFHPPPGHVRVAMDGFVDPADRPDFDAGMAQTCRFQQSPVEVLRMLMLMRRKGHGIDRSHMGRMLRGDMLALDDIERSDPDTRE